MHAQPFAAAARFQPTAGLLAGELAPMPTDEAYCGPERRSATSQATRWLAQVLDQIDYGLLLLVDGSRVVHVNHAARAELDGDHPLQLLGDALRAKEPHDVAPLHEVLSGAQRGLRKLVTLGTHGRRVSIAAVPLGPLHLGGPSATSLMFSKRMLCGQLSVQMFARSHALTPAETRVLEALCQGLDARTVAEQHQVELSTVRTQIGAIREKTGADSISDVLMKMAVLPPVRAVLRAT